MFVEGGVEIKLNIIEGSEGFEEGLDFGAFVHESIIGTIAKEVFEFFDGVVLVGLDLKRDEIFKFTVGTLYEEVLDFDGNDDFFIIEGYGAGFARSLHPLHEVEMSAFAPEDGQDYCDNVDVFGFDNDLLLILHDDFLL